MKIALLTDGIYPYVMGGMQRHSFYLAKYLAGQGHTVDLYHTNASAKDIKALELFTEEERRHIRSFVIPFPQMGVLPGHYIRESYEYSKRIYSLFSKQDPVDFIYVKGFSGWELLNRKSRGEHFPPIGLNFHGYEMFQPPASWIENLRFVMLLRPPVKFNVKHADYLFSYGGKITGVIQSLGVSPQRILEIPTGITPDWLNEDKKNFNGPRKFLFVGRYERRKGLPELYEAIRSLPREDNVEFGFVGNIPAKRRMASSRTHFYGAITDNEELRKIMRDAHVLICPSRSEGMPNVIVEALAQGIPVIATDVGAVSLMVNPQTGWLIPSNSPVDIKAAITAAAESPEKSLENKSVEAVKLVRNNFLWSSVGQQTVQAITSVLR